MKPGTQLTIDIKQLCDSTALVYDQERGHGILSVDETNAWQRVLYESPLQTGNKCLEVGAGTGVFTRLLLPAISTGGNLIAQDISQEALRISKANLPLEFRDVVEFCPRDAQDKSAITHLEKNSLDVIVARQFVVLLQDPLAVFEIWRDYLKKDGHLIIYDALWTRKSWSGNWSTLVDALPLSCLQSIQTIPYLLKSAGFSIKDVHFLDEVNTALGEDGVECPRFTVVACH